MPLCPSRAGTSAGTRAPSPRRLRTDPSACSRTTRSTRRARRSSTRTALPAGRSGSRPTASRMTDVRGLSPRPRPSAVAASARARATTRSASPGARAAVAASLGDATAAARPIPTRLAGQASVERRASSFPSSRHRRRRRPAGSVVRCMRSARLRASAQVRRRRPTRLRPRRPTMSLHHELRLRARPLAANVPTRPRMSKPGRRTSSLGSVCRHSSARGAPTRDAARPARRARSRSRSSSQPSHSRTMP